MSKINVQGINDVVDPFYRYTMVKMNVVRQKNKTVIDNIDNVAKDLERDPKLIADFFKKKYSIALFYKNGVVSMSADIKYSDFELGLREFIELYVLCPKCHLPETTMSKENDKIILDCKCCSHKSIKQVKK